MAVLVLVPGAYLGAWAWEETARALEGRGHTALPLTLTGLAERAGDATPATDLDTHVADITGFVEGLGVPEVTLVAHSYGAAPVTGAAARLGGRVARVVYVDSAPFAEGLRVLDLMPPEDVEAMRRQVAERGDGMLPAPSPEKLGEAGSLDGLGPDRLEQLRARATAQPFGTFERRLSGPAEPGPGVDRVVVACHDFQALLAAAPPMLAFLNQPPWRRFDLATGHWPMLSAPAELASVLDRALS
ncbi:alpha/beta fold hydrolase [Streptomyces yaizuensis]|uniref:Alpha/beta fold hydrolase n=1 Tax=Streptomyces yaizuensis TaxID=2989713 RepID=A0ABQ5P2Y3_9ACTN|nr:alpha/beta fold hydrolase [Streptomyces sp. YSPA8]GLF96862.1 alpha/beta fold hydrolase [Streptomyces sp. YSPA8]